MTHLDDIRRDVELDTTAHLVDLLHSLFERRHTAEVLSR
jgi:hypothetical protein